MSATANLAAGECVHHNDFSLPPFTILSESCLQILSRHPNILISLFPIDQSARGKNWMFFLCGMKH